MDTGHVNTVSTMGEENSSEVAAYAAHNFRKRNLKRRRNIESLPDDVVFDILARLPAHDIRYAVKLVCRKWYQTIRTCLFVRAHLQQSTCGLAFHPFGNLFATQQKGPTIEISQFDYKFKGIVGTSCNGLMVESYCEKTELEFRITNPATNQHMDLPSSGLSGKVFFTSTAIAYAVASKEYKVVRSFHPNSGEVECAILTVGVDEDWKRRVDIKHLSPTAKMQLLGEIPPSSTDGFVHWAQNGSGSDSEYVLTLNVETEIVTQFPVPPFLRDCGGKTKLLYHYFPMGSYLSLLIGRDSESFPMWDQVWVMKPESGEWTKMMSIDSKSLKRAFEVVSAPLSLRPVGWLKLREVLVFGSRSWSSCIAYNVRTQEIESKFNLGFCPIKFVAHKNTLVWLD